MYNTASDNAFSKPTLGGLSYGVRRRRGSEPSYISNKRIASNMHVMKHNVNDEKQKKKNTFSELSPLPNAELKGELLWVCALGLFASDESPSLLVSSLLFQS